MSGHCAAPAFPAQDSALVAHSLSRHRAIMAYLQAKGLSPTQALLRLDGLYGTTSPLARIQHAGLGFLTRGRDYQLLDHSKVQARLQHPCDVILRHDETNVQQEVFDVGYITNQHGLLLMPLVSHSFRCHAPPC